MILQTQSRLTNQGGNSHNEPILPAVMENGDDNDGNDNANNVMRRLRLLPVNIIRDYIYPFAIRIIENREQLRSAVIEYKKIQQSGRPFPEGYCPIEHWDVSKVTDFSWLFTYQTSFQGDLSRWDVSNGTNFSDMFSGCESLTSDFSRWDVSSATDLSHMFYRCESLTSDFSRWDVSNVVNFAGMFVNCRLLMFNPLQGNVPERVIADLYANELVDSDDESEPDD